MAAVDSRWSRVDPDRVVDDLPQPYKLITELLEEVFDAVDDRIFELSAERNQEGNEVGLRQVLPTVSIPVLGGVSCSCADQRGSCRMLVGTSSGEVLVIDSDKHMIVAQKRVFNKEPVRCVSAANDGAYPPPAVPGELHPGRPSTKVFVAGGASTEVLVYNTSRDEFGGSMMSLTAACSLRLPEPVGGESGVTVEQLHSRGTVGAIWVLVLLSDRRLLAYQCPLGAPQSSSMENVSRQVIQEEDETHEDNMGATQAPMEEEFQECEKVAAPAYSLQLPAFAIPGFPEPSSADLRLSALLPPAMLIGTPSGAPLRVMASSAQSNLLAAFSLPGPRQQVAPTGMAVDELLRQPPPALGSQPAGVAETVTVAPGRTWSLSAKTTAVAASTGGALFAAAGASGAIVLIDMASGPSLGASLPGHYAEVVSLAFHRTDTLVSVGKDAWVHHYSMASDTLLYRYLISAPPTPLPALQVVASRALPIAVTVDEAGGLKMLDVGRGRKIAQLLCSEAEAAAPQANPEAEEPGPGSDYRACEVLTTANGFFALCRIPPPAPPDQEAVEAGAAEPARADAAEGAEAEGAAEPKPETTWLCFFDQVAILKGIFPGLAAAVPTDDVKSLARLFSSFTAEELAQTVTSPQSISQAVGQERTAPAPLGSVSGVSAGTLQGRGVGHQSSAQSIASTERRTMPLTAHFETVPDLPQARLTAENLRNIGAPSVGRGSVQGSIVSKGESKGEVTTLFSMGSGKPDAAKFLMHALDEGHPRAEHWQASVRKCLRGHLAERERRQKRIGRRIEQFKKDVSDA